jgi:hypothetical protein
MPQYDNIKSSDYDEQEIYHRCNRWSNRIVMYAILGCHIYMIVKGINPYGIV